MQPYQLSKSVYDTLVAAANGDSYAFAILEPREDESAERKRVLNREMNEILDLIQMDLLKDVSDSFTEQIALCRVNNGFGYKVVRMTEMALLMFTKRYKESIN